MGGRGSRSGGAGRSLLSSLGSDERLVISADRKISIKKRDDGDFNVVGLRSGKWEKLVATRLDKKQTLEIIDKNIKEGRQIEKVKSKPFVPPKPIPPKQTRTRYVKTNPYSDRSVDVKFGERDLTVSVRNVKTWTNGKQRRVYFDIGSESRTIGQGYVDSSKNARLNYYDREVRVGRRRIVLPGAGEMSGKKAAVLENAVTELFSRKRK